MVNCFRYVITIKNLAILMIVQFLVVMLYINTISVYFEYVKYNSNQLDYEFDLTRILVQSSLSEEEYNILITDLEENGVEIYNYFITQSQTSNEDVYSILTIDPLLAKRFEKLGMIKVIDKTGEVISSKRVDNQYGKCKEIALLGETISCEKDEIYVDASTYEKAFNFYYDYSTLLMAGTYFKYSGDLEELCAKIIDERNLDIKVDIFTQDMLQEEKDEGVEVFIGENRQNIIAITFTSLLLIILVNVNILLNLQRNISILMLLGYSTNKIILSFLTLFLISLTIPTLILILSESGLILEYIILNFIIS